MSGTPGPESIRICACPLLDGLWEFEAKPAGLLEAGAFLTAVLTGTARTDCFGHLYEVLKLTEHRFETADLALGTSGQ
ncbi:hypothetical protein [Streptomyces virginiae]|uniref:hypothetical protein n=1 Tax=Streptomyces virginiae TaxID=1961 RepID=UPI003628209F